MGNDQIKQKEMIEHTLLSSTLNCLVTSSLSPLLGVDLKVSPAPNSFPLVFDKHSTVIISYSLIWDSGQNLTKS